MQAKLVPIEGGDPIVLVKDMTLVGRKEDCDLRLDHKSVSKLHCVIVKTDGLLLLRDLGSTNSTRVNGQRVRRAALLPNDQLTIANFKFKVYFGEDEVVPPDEFTQHIDARELAKLVKGEKQKADHAKPAVHTNQLPDVYPDSSVQKAK